MRKKKGMMLLMRMSKLGASRRSRGQSKKEDPCRGWNSVKEMLSKEMADENTNKLFGS